MIKIYNSSDSESYFINVINSKLKGQKFNSIQDYTIFEKNIIKLKAFELEENQKEILYLTEETIYLKFKNKRISEKIKISKKYLSTQNLTIKYKYGEIKEEIKEEINQLEKEIKKLEEEITKNKEQISENTSEIKSLKTTKKTEINSNFEHNKNELKNINKDKILMKFLRKAEGENKIITEIASKLATTENTYLINSLELTQNLEKSKTNIQNKTSIFEKIDHLLLSSNGLFIIKAITWKSSTPTPAQKIIIDLEKQITEYKKLFKSQYSDLINKQLEIIVVFINSEIQLDKSLKIKSTKIENLEKLITPKKEKLSTEQIIEILDELSPNIKGFSITDKMSIKGQKSYSKVKNFIKSKF